MRRRPWPIFLLAFCQLLAPFLDLIVSSWFIEISPRRLFNLYMEFFPPWQHFQTFGLPLLSAAAIYAVKAWSYPLFLGISAWTLFNHLSVALSFPDYSLRLFYILLSSVLNLALVSYFFLPAVRATYLNSKLRWWEPAPRYKIQIDGQVLTQKGDLWKVKIMDLSEGGVFIQFASAETPLEKAAAGARLRIHQKVTLSFTFFNLVISARALVVHRTRIGVDGYGLQLIHLDRVMRTRMKRLSQALDLLGVEARQGRKSWRLDLAEWLATLIATGTGMVPPLPQPRKRIPRRRLPAASSPLRLVPKGKPSTSAAA